MLDYSRSDAELVDRIYANGICSEGPWHVADYDPTVVLDNEECEIATVRGEDDAEFIARNNPDVVYNDIREILYLRKVVARLTKILDDNKIQY